MRPGPAIFVASMAALLALAAPGLARNSETPKSSEQQAAPPPCHSYQQAADGSWIERPCEALGVPTPPQHKSATRKTDERTR